MIKKMYMFFFALNKRKRVEIRLEKKSVSMFLNEGTLEGLKGNEQRKKKKFILS